MNQSTPDADRIRTDIPGSAPRNAAPAGGGQLAEQTYAVLKELAGAAGLAPGRLIVIGASTSEVAGARIGTAGALEVAGGLLAGVTRAAEEFGFHPVFQCCEHLNRALVMERAVLERFGLTEVSAVPVPRAGGSMAAAAYRSLRDPVLAASVQAHAGVDIGETLIGMHLRAVAVPFRPGLRYIGKARVNAAWSRPPLIGGERAVYRREAAGEAGFCD